MRAIIPKQRSLLMVIFALALLVRTVIPAGFMVSPSSLKLTVQICADGAPGQTSIQVEVPLSKGGQRDNSDHGQKSQPCAFSALSMASMAGGHSTLLIVALAVIVGTIVTNGATHLQRKTRHLRPPLRGPPLFA
jgi:MFS-type transporter involved in bile tolerance (Atg22 family)